MKQKIIMTKKEIDNAIKKISKDIFKKVPDLTNIALIGIVTRGIYIAQRIQKLLKIPGEVSSLDITFYRDDVNSIAKQPKAHETKILVDLTGKNVILIDDVLFTGRSIRSALNELIDFGRPKRVYLAVLIDRGHRELPIQADFVGKKIKTKYTDEVIVKLKEVDKVEKVILKEK